MKIQVGDIAMEYDIDGPEDGPVLVLHHTLGTSLEMWEELNIAIAQNYRVLRYDARGHGGTQVTPAPYNFQQLASDAVGLMAALGIEKAYHAGASMGGMVAQYLSFGAPQTVSGLILISTACQMGPEAKATWDQRMAEVRANGMAPQAPDTIKRWFTRDFRIDEENAELMGQISQLIAATPVEGYCGWGAAIRDLDFTPYLARVAAPVLVMVGAQDPGTPPAMSKQIAELIPGAQLRIVEDASHMLPLQQPDLFIESLIDFIEDCEDAAEGEV